MMESAISPVERASRAVAIEQLLNEEGRLSDDTQLDALAAVISPPDRSASKAAPAPALDDDAGAGDDPDPLAAPLADPQVTVAPPPQPPPEEVCTAHLPKRRSRSPEARRSDDRSHKRSRSVSHGRSWSVSHSQLTDRGRGLRVASGKPPQAVSLRAAPVSERNRDRDRDTDTDRGRGREARDRDKHKGSEAADRDRGRGRDRDPEQNSAAKDSQFRGCLLR